MLKQNKYFQMSNIKDTKKLEKKHFPNLLLTNYKSKSEYTAFFWFDNFSSSCSSRSGRFCLSGVLSFCFITFFFFLVTTRRIIRVRRPTFLFIGRLFTRSYYFFLLFLLLLFLLIFILTFILSCISSFYYISIFIYFFSIFIIIVIFFVTIRFVIKSVP